MTRKEKIMQILGKWYPNFANNESCANAILTLPIEVPSEEDAINESNELKVVNLDKYPEWERYTEDILFYVRWGFKQGSKWAMDEIIKRNNIKTKENENK